MVVLFFFFKQKTAYEIYQCDWSSDVCSSDLSPLTLPYWNETYYIILQNESGLFCKYAEIDGISVNEGQIVKAGELIGKVARVLNLEKIDSTSPEYIKSLQRNKISSMLHFELYRVWPVQFEKYLGGNSFARQKPKNLLDPAGYLKKLL